MTETKDNLASSPGENGGKQNAQEDLHLRAGGDETKGKTQEKMERRGRKGSSCAGSEEKERTGDRCKKLQDFFGRPKPTVGCSATGKRRIIPNINRMYRCGYCETVNTSTGSLGNCDTVCSYQNGQPAHRTSTIQ
jgi:hypothetical protein